MILQPVYRFDLSLEMNSFDSTASSFIVSAVSFDDEFYDYSDFEPISMDGFSHYGEMPVVKVAVNIPAARPIVHKPKRQATGCRYV